MLSRLGRTRAAWDTWLTEPKSPSARAIRRAGVGRILHFYAERALRHHLSKDVYERLRREIDKFLINGDGYSLLGGASTDVGYLFCPEYRREEPERFLRSDDSEAPIVLFGPSLVHVLSASSDYTEDPVATTAIPYPQKDSGSTMNPPRSELTLPGTEIEAPEASADGAARIVLGRHVISDEPVEWSVGIRGNPHLMLVGLPGMGKTTSLINICRQLRRSGVAPIVFSYHQDIDDKLKDEFSDLHFVDYDGLGFNPLRVEATNAMAHIDVAGELRDIFAAIFTDLGDLQTEDIRSAIKQSYTDAGWGAQIAGNTESPAFRAFFNILQSKPKPDRGLMARLTELDDYGFFNASGATRTLLGAASPAVIRIHRTSNDLLQKAFASFVLYSIYKDMFRRGVQARLTHAVIFDEAHRASRLKLLPTMAKECRKYGLALILASQEARDFDQSLFSAIASYLAFRVTESDAKAVARVTCSSDIERRTVDRLKQLDRYQALFFSEARRRPTQVALAM